ncbi:MAG TPA: 16S rRNA (guanine(527)-N(7))-methyltransferase RsmG [Thermoleophilaceae bacterium]|nr:16S rRNA (guanine(527)-N(7))-methyltransferase RsmG [Thermoleophilaceae bacterium]
MAALEAEPDPPTRLRRGEEAVDGHLADSLSGLEVPEVAAAARIGDLGSGAGFPGLVLAIALPSARVDLIESQGRKTAVIDRLLQAAHVTNARSVTARAEEWAANPPPFGGRESYDLVTARAVGSLAEVAEYASPLLRESGVLVAWKGARDASEEEAASRAAGGLGLRVREVLSVQPFAGARDRHLHVLVKAGPTPEGLPRRPGMARKRPFGSERSGSDRRGG